MTTDFKAQIVTQSHVNASAHQVLLSLRLGTDEGNPVFKAKDVYNQRPYQRCKELGPFSPVQALMQRLNNKKG